MELEELLESCDSVVAWACLGDSVDLIEDVDPTPDWVDAYEV